MNEPLWIHRCWALFTWLMVFCYGVLLFEREYILATGAVFWGLYSIEQRKPGCVWTFIRSLRPEVKQP